MRYPVTINAYDGEVRRMIVPVIPVDVVKVDALIGSCHAACLAFIDGCVEEFKRLRSVSFEYSKRALAFERLLVMFLAIQRRSFAQFLGTHRTLPAFSCFGSFIGGSQSLPFCASFAFYFSFANWIGAAGHTQTRAQSLELVNGVVVKAKPTRGLNSIIPHLIKHLKYWDAINFGPARHRKSSSSLGVVDVHVTQKEPILQALMEKTDA